MECMSMHAGKPHIIKEENFLLFGVVEEKAFKAKSQVITFDLWSIRRNVLQDRTFNAALILQQGWRAHRDRKRRLLRKNRSSANATKFFKTPARTAPEFFRHNIVDCVPENGSDSDEALPDASSMATPRLPLRLDSLVAAAADAMT